MYFIQTLNHGPTEDTVPDSQSSMPSVHPTWYVGQELLRLLSLLFHAHVLVRFGYRQICIINEIIHLDQRIHLAAKAQALLERLPLLFQPLCS